MGLRSVARSLGAWLLLAAWAWLVICTGGTSGTGRAEALVLVGVALVALALGLSRRRGLPDLGWVGVLMALLLALPLAQALPLGWHHPWTAAEPGAALDSWAVDRDGAALALVGMAGWGALLVGVVVAWRGERVWRLAQVLVIAVTAHAVTALFLAPLLPNWPTEAFAGRVRGTLVYPNHAVDLWGACLPLALAWASADRANRLRWVLAASVLGAAVVLSASRGGILVTALVSLPFLWRSLPRRRRLLWALGGALVVSAWLVTLNLDQVVSRFESLQGSQGATLNGRLLIWEAVLPESATATNWWGAGGGSGPLAYLRGAGEAFTRNEVNALHSDAVEWLVQYGWVGVALLAGALAYGTWVLRRLWQAAAGGGHRRGRTLARGAVAGVVILLLHATAELTWYAPALAMEAALLLAIAFGSLTAETERPARRTGWTRLALGALGLVTVGLAVGVEWPRTAEQRLARSARWAADQRLKAELDPRHAAAVQELFATPVTTTVGALSKAELSLALSSDVEAQRRAEEALAVVDRQSPAHPLAWALRARLARLRQDQAGERQAIDHLRQIAPTWIRTRLIELSTLLPDPTAPPSQAALNDPVRRQEALRRVLQADLPTPPEVLDLAATELGEATVRTLLTQAPPNLLPSALPWLRAHGELSEWLPLVQQVLPRTTGAEDVVLMRAVADPAPMPPVQVPPKPADRLNLLEALGRARLPIPEELAEACRQDGTGPAAVVRWWTTVGKDLDRAWLQRWAEGQETMAPFLHLPPAKRAWEDALRAKSMLNGQTSGVDLGTWPPLVWQAYLIHQEHPEAHPDETPRLLGLLQAITQRGWWDLPNRAGKGLWVIPGTFWPEVELSGWTGIAANGVWREWKRGNGLLPVPDAVGMQCLQLLDPDVAIPRSAPRPALRSAATAATAPAPATGAAGTTPAITP